MTDSTATVAGSEVSAAPKTFKAPDGYRVTKRDGVMLYCKEFTPIGTRFKEVVCLTEAQVEEMQRRGDSIRQDMQQRATICSTPSGTCGGG